MDERKLKSVLSGHFADVRELMDETVADFGRKLNAHLSRTEAALVDVIDYQEDRLKEIEARLERLESART